MEGQLYFLISCHDKISSMRSKIHFSLCFYHFCVRLLQEKFSSIFSKYLILSSDKHCFCLTLSALLCNGKFHKHLQELFVPLVVRYVDLMESSIAQSIHRGFEQETWQPVK